MINAPIQTSRQAMLASGRILNIIPKSRVITASDKIELRIWMSASIPGTMAPNCFPTKAMAAVSNRETRSRNPTTKIKPKERMRSRMMPRIPRPGLGCTPDYVQGRLELAKDARGAEREE